MRQFQVPQFITVEDKVIGPLTVKQSLYVGAGALLIVAVRIFFEPFLFWPLAVLIASFASTLAFLKIGGQPFPTIVKHAVFYIIQPHLYIWKKEEPKKTVERMKRAERKKKEQDVLVQQIPKMSKSKLSDLSWSLDIKSKTRT